MRNNNCNNCNHNCNTNTNNCGTNKTFTPTDENSGKSSNRSSNKMQTAKPLRFGSGQSSEFFRQTKMQEQSKEEEKCLPSKNKNHPINKRARQKAINEFWRIYNAYNELEGNAHIKFDESLENLYAALNGLTFGIKINSKGSRIDHKLDELLNTLHPEYSDTSDSEDREDLREELHKLVAQIESLEKESLDATKAAITKLEEANELHNALNEIKGKLEQNCYPK